MKDVKICNWNAPENLTYFSILFFAVALPIKYGVLTNLAAALLILTWLFAIIKGKIHKPANNILLYTFLSVFALHLIGIAYSHNLQEAISQLEKKALLLICPVVLSTLLPFSEKKLETVLFTFAITTTLIGLICVIATYYINLKSGIGLEVYNAWYYSSENLTNRFGFHPNYMAMYAILSILIILKRISVTINHKNYYKSVLYFIIIIFLTFFIALLSARMQMIILFILFVSATVYLSIRLKKPLYGFILTILITCTITASIASSPILKEKFKGLFGLNIDNDNQKFSADLRFQKWSSVLSIVAEHPLIGVGTGDIQNELQKQYRNKGYDVAYEAKYNSHNQYLDFAGRFGVIGLFILLISLLYPLLYALKLKNTLYIGFIILIILSFIPEVVLSLNKGVAFYSFFNSLFAFSYLQQTPECNLHNS